MNDLLDPLLSDLALFVRVADSDGFSAAARLTKVPQATVSRRIAVLEQKLDVRLFDRTTRRIALTDPGRRIYQHARLMVEQGEAAISTLKAMQSHPSGELRVTSPVILGQAFVQDIVADYMATYPDVTVKLELTGRRVDIIEEGFDIAIRVGRLPDSGLALTRLGEATSGLYATLGYLEQAKTITAPVNLRAHPMLLPGASLDRAKVILSKNGQTTDIEVKPRLVCNDVQPILAAALKGLGVAQLPSFAAQPSLDNHQLMPVLEDWSLRKTEISGLTPSYRGTLPAVRQFLALAKEQLKDIS